MRVLLILIPAVLAALLTGCGGGLSDDNNIPEPRVITTPSGLKYADYFVSPVSMVSYGDTVVMDYKGFLASGEEFKNTFEDGSPVEFVVGDGKVIAGWDQGVVGMGIGGKRKLIVPPDLAYGSEGDSQLGIPPDATLSYYVEPKERTPVTMEFSESGLQWGDIVVGTGASPSLDDTIAVKYKGWLTDGTVFDSTAEGNTAEFQLSGLIQGWKEGIPTMKVGGIRKLIIPYDLGYGAEGKTDPNTGAVIIPPYSTLIFRIELVQVKPAGS